MNLMNRNRQPLSILLAGAILTTITLTPVSAEYNPKLGRFMQRDPNDQALVLSTALAMNAQTMEALAFLSPRGQYYDGLHIYKFAAGNPITGRDPTGTLTIPEVTVTTATMAVLIALGLFATAGLIKQIAKLTGGIAGYQAMTAEFAYDVDTGLEFGRETFALARDMAYSQVAEQVTALRAALAAAAVVGTMTLMDLVVLSSQAANVKRAQALGPEIFDHFSKLATGGSPNPRNHWREELEAWLNKIERLTKRMRGKTQQKWRDWVGAARKTLQDLMNNGSGSPPPMPG